jgi:hypothetical protein
MYPLKPFPYQNVLKENGKPTLKARGMAIPTMNKKKGITKSARLQPFHGACPILGHSPPASSTKIINYINPIKAHKFSIINK